MRATLACWRWGPRRSRRISPRSAPFRFPPQTAADTWAGRGGFGSRLLQQHNIAAIIFGGSFSDEDFRDRKVADRWFLEKYNQRLKTVDFEATTKYRFDPGFETGGTLGVNYASLLGRMLYFNYRSIYDREEERLRVHRTSSSITTCGSSTRRRSSRSGRPIAANRVPPSARNCARSTRRTTSRTRPWGRWSDLRPAGGRETEPARGSLRVRRHLRRRRPRLADGMPRLRQAGGAAELATTDRPLFSTSGFDVVADSAHNADVGTQILDAIVHGKGIVDMKEGVHKFARRLAHNRQATARSLRLHRLRPPRMDGPQSVLDTRRTRPMAIMGKYFMYYGYDFLHLAAWPHQRQLDEGRADARQHRLLPIPSAGPGLPR